MAYKQITKGIFTQFREQKQPLQVYAASGHMKESLHCKNMRLTLV